MDSEKQNQCGYSAHSFLVSCNLCRLSKAFQKGVRHLQLESIYLNTRVDFPLFFGKKNYFTFFEFIVYIFDSFFIIQIRKSQTFCIQNSILIYFLNNIKPTTRPAMKISRKIKSLNLKFCSKYEERFQEHQFLLQDQHSKFF
jgi:hypothetical protein